MGNVELKQSRERLAMESRSLIGAVFAFISLFWTACPASAQVTSFNLTSDATSIVAGQSITFTVTLAFTLPPFPQYIPGQTTFGSEGAGGFEGELLSGDGQTGGFGPTGGLVTFTYLTPGDYTVQAIASMLFHSVVCSDAYGGCEGFPNGGLAPGSFFVSRNEDITVSSVPEPSTWAMMLIGFAGLGFAFRQSRRRVSLA
jgi:PEP-CTERM motif